MKFVLPLLLLAGCSDNFADRLSEAFNHSTPVVMATGGGTASLTIIACPQKIEGGQLLQEVINNILQYQSPLVTADSGASSKLIINSCPFPPVINQPATIRTR